MEKPELFNLKELEILSSGDTVFIIKMIETFSLTIPPIVEKMKIALDKKSISELANIAHRLKPSFYYMGRMDLNEFLEIAENGNGSRNESEILAATNKFLVAYPVMKMAVDEHLEKLKQL